MSVSMQQLPERFKQSPRSTALEEYISRKYGTHGFRKQKTIEYNPEFVAEGSSRVNPDRFRWIENVSKGLRFIGAAHEIVRLQHTGWFSDNWQDETVHGEVYQLPARNGVSQYVPGVNDPCNDNCACLDFHSVTDDKEEAARWSDSMAENWAEREREYRAKQDAEQRLADTADEITEAYTDFRRISREIRANCDKLLGVAIVRELVRKEWARTKETIHRLRAEREKLERYGIEY